MIINEKEVFYDYREWLVSLVDTPNHDFSTHYSELMNILANTGYTWINYMNKSRYVDGIDMRTQYDRDINPYEINIRDVLRGHDCSILECFVALFTRYSDEILCEPGEESVAPELFYDCLSSLDLLFYDDFHANEDEIMEILTDFLEEKRLILCKKSVKKTKKFSDLWFVTGKFAIKKWI